jgi:TRAP-type C4-dicarboxylate transport system permease large subunit
MTQTTIMTGLLEKICDDKFLYLILVYLLIFFMGDFYHS